MTGRIVIVIEFDGLNCNHQDSPATSIRRLRRENQQNTLSVSSHLRGFFSVFLFLDYLVTRGRDSFHLSCTLLLVDGYRFPMQFSKWMRKETFAARLKTEAPRGEGTVFVGHP